jgi:hypothetical protein
VGKSEKFPENVRNKQHTHIRYNAFPARLVTSKLRIKNENSPVEKTMAV